MISHYDDAESSPQPATDLGAAMRSLELELAKTQGTPSSAGRLEDAITEWEAILELNPNDSQAVRYQLLAGYLAVNRLDGTAWQE